ncbi:sugar transferase [Pseudonocardia halophobica]|uniref:sugar transferase n=1 Tax=Pseudonocardia halophobica TaxID=29401 RepID=UPI003D89CE90
MGFDAGLDDSRDRNASDVTFSRIPPSRVSTVRPLTIPLGENRWERRYSLLVVAGDLTAIVASVVLGYVLNLGTYIPWLGHVSAFVGVVAGLLTVVCLYLTRVWEPKVLGQGAEEFSRLLRGFVTSAVLLGLLGLSTQALAVRPWVFGLIPLAGAMALAIRLALRARIHRLRARGRCSLPVLAVGAPESVAELVARTRRDTDRGWVVVAACTPTGVGEGGSQKVMGVPVVGDLDGVARNVRRGGHRIVAVGQAPGWTPRRLHELSWDLEGSETEIVVDPGLMDISGPRLHVQPVDGMLLLRLTKPTFSGVSWLIKQVVDRVGSALLLLVIAPALVALAIGVKLDGGPVFFRQKRVGRHGREFAMMKFRSMVVDAEARLAELKADNEGAGPLFKMRDDPRITRFGQFLRKYSLDELPQLFNVLIGQMSLVGPRPPLPAEVVQYGPDAKRKLLVRPGLTGLWQISGRSDLTWEQSVRLDLRYVETWNLALDGLILWRTLGAVARSSGAY